MKRCGHERSTECAGHSWRDRRQHSGNSTVYARCIAADFEQNAVLQDAVVRWLEIIGEAAYQLPADWKAAHGSIPWGDMMGMRNRLIHGYFAIDLDIVWETIYQNIDPLEQLIAAILAAEYP
jgi:uncharacterized protein with HEPN domain